MIYNVYTFKSCTSLTTHTAWTGSNKAHMYHNQRIKSHKIKRVIDITINSIIASIVQLRVLDSVCSFVAKINVAHVEYVYHSLAIRSKFSLNTAHRTFAVRKINKPQILWIFLR